MLLIFVPLFHHRHCRSADPPICLTIYRNLLTRFFTLQGQAVGDICLTFCNQNRRKNLLFQWNIYWELIKYLLRFSYLLPLRGKIFLSPVQTGVSQQKFLAGFLRYSGLFCSTHHDAFPVV